MNIKPLTVLAAIAALTAACATPPPPRPAPAPPPREDLTRIYFYPAQGQSEAQQDRDRYDCYVWAVKETGFDPSRHIPPPERATVVPARSPGQTIGAAAAVGAMIGAVTARPGDVAEGAAAGAIVGSVVGAANADAEARQADAINARHDNRAADRYAKEAAGYRRAMTACLEGRGYTVR